MKYLLVILFLAWQLVELSAQQTDTRDIVYLHDGSRIVGVVTEYSPDSHVKIITASGVELTLPASSVKRVDIGGPAAQSVPDATVPRKTTEKGFRYLVSSTLLRPYNPDRFGTPYPGFSLQGGAIYRFTPWVGAGVVTGFDYYESGTGQGLVPVYATGMLSMPKDANSLFFRAGLGYSIGVKQRNSDILYNKGGIFAQAGGGVEFFSRGRTAMLIELAYVHQETVFSFESWGWGWNTAVITEDITYRRLRLNLGITF